MINGGLTSHNNVIVSSNVNGKDAPLALKDSGKVYTAVNHVVYSMEILSTFTPKVAEVSFKANGVHSVIVGLFKDGVMTHPLTSVMKSPKDNEVVKVIFPHPVEASHVVLNIQPSSVSKPFELSELYCIACFEPGIQLNNV